MYFRFGRSYCYFRLSVVVAIIWEHFLSSLYDRKVTLCEYNYNSTYSGYDYWSTWPRNFASLKKIPYVFDVTPNIFQCTDWRSCCFILYPLHTQEKSRKGGVICQTGINFYGFLSPKFHSLETNSSIWHSPNKTRSSIPKRRIKLLTCFF